MKHDRKVNDVRLTTCSKWQEQWLGGRLRTFVPSKVNSSSAGPATANSQSSTAVIRGPPPASSSSTKMFRGDKSECSSTGCKGSDRPGKVWLVFG